MGEIDNLPVSEFGFPGPLRDTLVAAILAGKKTSTSSTLVEYGIEGDPLPVAGERYVVVDSRDAPVAIVKIVTVEQSRLVDVSWEHARNEGEGYSSLAEWRAGHERYWHGDDMRAFLGDPEFKVNDDTIVVLERFEVIRRLATEGSGLSPQATAPMKAEL
ncbi:ASCH domain-containing protein [Salinibacterium sp. NG253]|uniref:ASCH domain-containing protein n=1 Tax=Salinibacterium sp. NG253 TaxID=2792039 RepID=UPI0018CF6A97|nr:ASCH domain-containing protein [Salinibacterium sp. NG253]MBH0115289.1 ASCH domain-containing protein [Salinibacterium sp. NG253]